MKNVDTLRYSFHAIERSPMRTLLMLLAMSIGVAAVILLTGLGEAARRYVVNEFSALGTNLIIVLPGRSETTGGALGASMGGTTRDLTIDDAAALTRHASISRVAPLIVGAAGIQHSGLEREAVVYGTSNELLAIRHWSISQGQFLPDGNWSHARPVCVIGQVIQSELFGQSNALGQWLRIGESRCRVIGILSSGGRSMGFDVDDAVMIPVASAAILFNTQSLFRILVESRSVEVMESAKRFVRNTIIDRHHGEEDVTVITQDAVMQTFDQIFNVLTLSIGGIGAISLAVAGVLIMNVMLVSVAQRAAEIGLLKAVGAAPVQIILLFLVESGLLSLLGSIIGVGIGLGVAWLVSALYPALDMTPPVWAIIAGVAMALITGIAFGIVPARRASVLDPVASLAKR